MELGNMLFGNSRGEYSISRHEWFEEEIIRLFKHLGLDECYGGEYENEIFSIFPYYWGDCTCGCDEDKGDHKPECLLLKDNFVHYPTDLHIKWYKYPFRDSYSNRQISIEEFVAIIDDCIEHTRIYA